MSAETVGLRKLGQDRSGTEEIGLGRSSSSSSSSSSSGSSSCGSSSSSSGSGSSGKGRIKALRGPRPKIFCGAPQLPSLVNADT